VGAAGTVASLQEGQHTATLESKTNFFAGCRGGTLRAESTPLHKGRRTHVWQTRVTDEAGKLLSLTIQTQMIL
jgi:1,4-dihydroxy-2-naphthoyl-CoA hydrolase